MSAIAHLNKHPGANRAEIHECLLCLVERFPFYLHKFIPESLVVPAASAGPRIPSARFRFRIQNLLSQWAPLRGPGLLAGKRRAVFFSHMPQDGADPSRFFNDQKHLSA